MLKNIDEFLLYKPYVGIWALVLGRLDMFDSSQQHNIIVPDCVILREHIVSFIRGNVREITRCHENYFLSWHILSMSLYGIDQSYDSMTLIRSYASFYFIFCSTTIYFNSSLNRIILGYRSKCASSHSSSCTCGPYVPPLHPMYFAPPRNPLSYGCTCSPSVCPYYLNHTRGTSWCLCTLPVVLVTPSIVVYSSCCNHGPSLFPLILQSYLWPLQVSRSPPFVLVGHPCDP